MSLSKNTSIRTKLLVPVMICAITVIVVWVMYIYAGRLISEKKLKFEQFRELSAELTVLNEKSSEFINKKADLAGVLPAFSKISKLAVNVPEVDIEKSVTGIKAELTSVDKLFAENDAIKAQIMEKTAASMGNSNGFIRAMSANLADRNKRNSVTDLERAVIAGALENTIAAYNVQVLFLEAELDPAKTAELLTVLDKCVEQAKNDAQKLKGTPFVGLAHASEQVNIDVKKLVTEYASKVKSIQEYSKSIHDDFNMLVQNVDMVKLENEDSAFRFFRSVLMYIALIMSGITIMLMMANYLVSQMISKNLTLTNNFLKEISEGEGDLTQKIPVTTNDELGKLAFYFNTFVGKLNEIVSSVKSGSSSVASSSTQIASATEELSITIQEHTSQINSVASATEEITITSSEIMNSLDAANRETATAEELTIEGKTQLAESVGKVLGIKDRVEQLGSTIGNLSESSEEIGNIVNVINDIADQTNLLALNAAIEAARAGEQGRGFAVVADEVRKLAERTQTATKEIENIIGSLQSETSAATRDMSSANTMVNEGVEAIKMTASVFERIVNAMSAVNDSNSLINTSMSEQMEAINNINENAQAISSGVEESATALMEMTKALTDLQQQADSLHQMVEMFKTA